MSFTVDRCNACLHVVYPARYLCPRCQGQDWHPVTVRSGTLLQFTHMPGERAGDDCLGTLQTDDGPLVIARLRGTAHDKGWRYALRLDGDALIAVPESSVA
jgi:uncharacterized OB-fold protein